MIFLAHSLFNYQFLLFYILFYFILFLLLLFILSFFYFLSHLSPIPFPTIPPTLSLTHTTTSFARPPTPSHFLFILFYFFFFFRLPTSLHLGGRMFFLPYFPFFLHFLLPFFFSLTHTHYHFLLQLAPFLFAHFLHSLSPFFSYIPLISPFFYYSSFSFFFFPKNPSIFTTINRTTGQSPPASLYQLSIISHFSPIFFLSHDI